MQAIRIQLPILDEHEEFKIPSATSHELYIFNKFGKHKRTHNLVTGKCIYTFRYTGNGSNGKLTDVEDALGNKIILRRGYDGGNVYSISENTRNQQVKLKRKNL